MLDPDNPIYLLERGILFEKTHAINKAIEDFNAVIRLDQNNDQAWYNLANAHFSKSEYLMSIEYYSQAIALSPDKSDFYYNRSLAYYYSKDLESACFDMKMAESLGNIKAGRFIQRYCR